VMLSANLRGDIMVASSRNPSRTPANSTVGLTADIDWDPREAIIATVGADAKDALYLHLSSLRAQHVQGLADGSAPRVWEEARRDPSDYPVVIDTTPRGFVAASDEGVPGAAVPRFDTDGMQGVPAFVLGGYGCYVSRASTGFYEKETVDALAPQCRSMFPNMRDAAGAGARFIVTMLFRIESPVAADGPRYVFEQGQYSLYYDVVGADTLFRFTYPDAAGATITVDLLQGGADIVGTNPIACVFSFTHAGHNIAGSEASLYAIDTSAGPPAAYEFTTAPFVAGIPRRAERTVLGGPVQFTAPPWRPLLHYAVGDLVWWGGNIWSCATEHTAYLDNQRPPPDAVWGTGYVAKLGMKGAIAEVVTFLGGSSTAVLPHDTANTATMQDFVEGYVAHAYGRQGVLPTAHTYDAAPPPGTGSPVSSTTFGGINVPSGLTVKYSRGDGHVMWILANEACGSAVVTTLEDVFYTATVEAELAAGPGITRVKQHRDLGTSVLTTGSTVWSILDSVADSFIGNRVQLTVDACGDLYLPYVGAAAGSVRELWRLKSEGAGFSNTAIRFRYTLGSDAYPVIALPAGLQVDERLGGVPALWSDATTYVPGNRVKMYETIATPGLNFGPNVARHFEAIAISLNQAPPNATYWREVDTCGPEFLYVATVDPTPTTSPSYSVRRVEVLRRVATGSSNPREVSLLAVTENGTVSRYAASTGWTTVAASVLPGTYVWSATLFGKTFLGNGTGYRVYDHQTKALRSFDEATVGRIPPRCRLGCAWRGRLVVARGDSASDWFMSAVAEPFNFEFFPDLVTETQAVSGASSQVGEIPDLVNALVPMSDDLLAFGCDSSIWMLYGDPMTSGVLNRLSTVTGMAFGSSWCADERGAIYFVGSRSGFYRMTPDGGVQPLSEGRIHRRAQEIDMARFTPRAIWNDLDGGVHFFFVPTDGKGEAIHYFWERATGAWWPDQFHGAGRQVRGVYLSDGDHPQDRAILLGCADGRVRRWSPSAVDDDGEQIRASVLVGPVNPDTFPLESRVTCVEVVLARDQGGAVVGVLGTNEADVPMHVGTTALVKPGRSGYTRMRARGSHIWVEIAGAELGQAFAVEDLALQIAPAGRKRARS
jgi:hypothetical protein